MHNHCTLESIISRCQRDFARLTIFTGNLKKILKEDFCHPRIRNRIRVRYDIRIEESIGPKGESRWKISIDVSNWPTINEVERVRTRRNIGKMFG